MGTLTRRRLLASAAVAAVAAPLVRMYDVTEALVRRGYRDADIRAVLGWNFQRVLAQIWTS